MKRLSKYIGLRARKRTRAGPKAVVQTANAIAARRARASQLKQHALAASFLAIGSISSVLAIATASLALRVINVSHALELQGRLQAIDQATPVNHETGGVVKDILVADGEIVREGQVLLSLGTEDLKDRHIKTQQKLAGLLLRSGCLRSKHAQEAEFKPSQILQLTLARLNQSEAANRAIRNCRAELEALAIERARDSAVISGVTDRANLAKRQAEAAQTLHLQSTVSELHETDAVSQTKLLQAALEAALAASRAQQTLETLVQSQRAAQLRFQTEIATKLEQIAQDVIAAEADLSRVETLMRDRFVYASTSGRIQRMRLSGAGKRIAGGAWVMEIAPLATDFEVLATIGITDLPDVSENAQVRVKISGSLKGDVWIPATISKITKISRNKRLLTIFLSREDLNKRDLLRGEFALNGLGEQSDVLVAVKSETAWRSLGGIIARNFTAEDV